MRAQERTRDATTVQGPPAEVRGSRASQVPERQPERPLTILCPTYWYPEHATDIHATYVHDINRHLVERGHRVRVVTPGHPDLPPHETFDGVEIVRFPLVLPDDELRGDSRA